MKIKNKRPTCHMCKSFDVKCVGRALGNMGKLEYKCGSCGTTWQDGYGNKGFLDGRTR